MGGTGMMAVIRMMTVVEGVDLDGYSGVARGNQFLICCSLRGGRPILAMTCTKPVLAEFHVRACLCLLL